MLNIIQAVGDWSAAKILHSGLLKRERQMTLMDFRTGRVPLLVAVDVLNEGVDVPDVNIVCFARVTHSRRIFVQQLGRGLRLSQGKEFVTVLDFVSDLRRVAATMNLRQLVAHEAETLYIPSSHSITFEDKKAENLMTEWLKDAANLDTASDEVKLSFPDYSD
jgi:superfamily II DNA or RNA helicase